MRGLVFDFGSYKTRIESMPDGSRQITFYFNESEISRKDGANIIRKCKKNWPFLKDGNTLIKTEPYEKFYGTFEDKTEDLILLNKKNSFNGKKVKTYGKFVDYKETKARNRKGEDLYIYNLSFAVPKEKVKFESTLFANEQLDIAEKFKKGTYYILTGTLEFNEFSTKKLKACYRHAGLKSYNFKIGFRDYPVYEYDESKFKQEEIGRHVLHAHTIYSRNDAFIKFKEVKEAFEKNVLNSFAITDHRESRGFLDAQATFKGTDYKVIPGLEAEVFDDTDGVTDLDTCPRYHMVLLIKCDDTTFNYKGKDVKVNEGFRALNELITNANLNNYSNPSKEFKAQQEADGEFKSSAKPLMSLKQVLEYKEKGYLAIGSACIAGTVRKYWFQMNMEKFTKYFNMVDWVEIHPLHNEMFTISSPGYPFIKSFEDIKTMNRKLVEYCIEHNKPFVFGDDAHVATKEDRVVRQYFKLGEIAKFSDTIKAFEKETNPKRKQELLNIFLEDNSEEKQPFLHTFTQMKEELLNQGFDEKTIEMFSENEKNIASNLPSIQDITLVPKVMITPGFPGVDLKKVIPELTWKFAIKKWSTDGTIETIDQKIVNRIKTELKAIDSKDYEVLYYFARFLVQKSLEKGYIVGSRGSVGSSILAYCLEISENNPLSSHYYCSSCKEIEWVDMKNAGLDLPHKKCKCGGTKKGDGLNIEFSSFLGFNHDKVPDIDLNFSSKDLDSQISIQNQVVEEIKKFFPDTVSSIRSGTFSQAAVDGLNEKVLSKIPNLEEVFSKELVDLEALAVEMEGVYTNAGQHPGGELVWDNTFPVSYCFAFNWVGEFGKKTALTNSVDYHSIEEFAPKLDILGKKDPALLKNMARNCKNEDFIMHNMDYNDPFIYKCMCDIKNFLGDKAKELPYKAGTLGIPELTTFFSRGVIEKCQPKGFSDMVRLEGLTHGTMVWELAEPLIEKGMSMDEIPWCTRDEMFTFFTKVYGADPTQSFKAIEFIRKGKWGKAPDMLKSYMKGVLPDWVYDNCTKIKYLFPSAHAASYFMIAYRFMWFKVYKTGYAFADFFNSLADDLPNFDYENGMEIRTLEQYEHFLNFYIPKTANDQAKKKQTLMANMLFEANLFGIKLEKASIHSKPNLFFYDESENTIYMPLTSLPGISGEATVIREILDSVDFSITSLEKLMKVKVDGFTKEGKPAKKGLKKNYVTALKLEEYYIKNGYKLKEPNLFDLI